MEWFVYRDGECVAKCAELDDAVYLVSQCGCKQIKYLDRFLVWNEGQEEFTADWYEGEAAEIILQRASDQEAEDYNRRRQFHGCRVFQLSDYRK